MNALIKQVASRLKPYLRWIILGGTLFFLVQAFKTHWREVVAIRISGFGWAYLALALAVTLLAHVWSGWVWGWIIKEFNQPVRRWWSIRVYLKTNIAKYLPGNVWHFYGRVLAGKWEGIPIEIATLSVLMEPLLMAAAALLFALITGLGINRGLEILSLAAVLMSVHPRILNPLLQYLRKVKAKAKGTSQEENQTLRVKRYPLRPLIGELCFLGLRGTGFLLTMLALGSFTPAQIPLLLSAFSLSWLLGLVVPGAPGGLGVFEATAITLLDGNFSSAFVLSTVALYRFVSIMAEVSGAFVVWVGERWSPISPQKKTKDSN